MATRVYLLLELTNGNKANAANTLRGMPGISVVDILEGPPDLVIVIEAPARQEAVEYLMGILNAVDGVIEDVRVLPVCESLEKKARESRINNQRVREVFKEEMRRYV
jgi:hypothetical protein